MPFVSERQRKYLWANKPGIASQWQDEMKKAWWNIIKLTEEDMKTRPDPNVVHSINITPRTFINTTNPYHTGKPYTKDSIGWNKWKHLIELISTKGEFTRFSDDRYSAKPEEHGVYEDENGNLLPAYWDPSTGWDIDGLDEDTTILMQMEGESGYKPLPSPSNSPFMAPPPPPPKER